MKTQKLFLIFALLGVFNIALSQTTYNVSGTLTNTNGTPVTVHFVPDSANVNYFSAITDVNGNYSSSFVTNITQGSILMYVHDCAGDSIMTTAYFSPASNNIVFPTYDYCPSTSTGCYAYFSIDQATTANGAIIPGTLVVTDSSGGSNLTYSWAFGDGSNGTGIQLTHSYNGNGPYVLCLTIDDGAGCTDTFCDTISVDSSGLIIEEIGFDLIIGEHSLNITDHDYNSSVSLYPNPATENINIEFNMTEETLNEIKMFDLSGKLIYQEKINNSTELNIITINTQSVESGTYLIQMSFNNKLLNKKVIIK